MKMINKKYQVFVSSTYADLKKERSEIIDLLLRFDCIPIGMEYFPANNLNQMEYIARMIETSDYYILISAGKYGTIDQSTGLGYTEMEYDYASSIKIPIMSFLHTSPEKLSPRKRETKDEYQIKLKAFQEKVSKGKLVNFYSETNDLVSKVASSLAYCIKEFPSNGWIKADNSDINEDLENRINEILSNKTLTKTAIVEAVKRAAINVGIDSGV